MVELFLSKIKQSDLFTTDGLQKQTGMEIHRWNIYIIKELLDNAIDACESIGVPPKIQVRISKEGKSLIFSVKDNAGGMTKDQLEKIIDLSTYSGTKYYYRRCSRGMQGNALLTILGIPFVLDRTIDYESGAAISIITNGVGYSIRLTEDRIAQAFKFDLIENSISNTQGTEIIIKIPDIPVYRNWDWEWDNPEIYLNFMREYSIFNPHVEFSCNILSTELILRSDGELDTFKGKESIYWYSINEFKELVFAYLRAGSNISTKKFCVERFKGISNDTPISVILDGIGCKHLSDFREKGDAEIEILYNNLKDLTEYPSPKILGQIGKERFKKAFGDTPTEEIKYKPFIRNVEYRGRIFPYVLEIAAAPLDSSGEQLSVGINHAPTFRVPDNIREILSYSNSLSGSDNVKVLIHISCPAIDFSNYGKSEFDINPFEDDLKAGLKYVLEPYLKIRDRKRRELYKSNKVAEDEQKKTTTEAEKEVKLRQNELFRETIDDVYDKTTDNRKYMPKLRMVYYQHRPVMQARGADISSYNYYRTLFEAWEEELGLEMANREERGYIIHPRNKIPQAIDTKFAKSYVPPDYEFNKVLYIEKRGFIEYLVQDDIHGKYDMALIGGQGESTWANRKVLRKIVEKNPKISIFCLHDCDIYGMHIKNSLEKEHYIEGWKVKVVSMGLRPEEAITKKHPVEMFEDDREFSYEAISQVVTKEEFEWLIGKKKGENSKGKTIRICNRVELNVFPPGQFIQWVQDKLKEFGVTEKVMPPDEVFEKETNDVFKEKLDKIITAIDVYSQHSVVQDITSILQGIVNEKNAIDEIKKQLDEDLHPVPLEVKAEVENKLSANPVENWKNFIRSEIEDNLTLTKQKQKEVIRSIIDSNTDSNKLAILQKFINMANEEISKISKNHENPHGI